MKYPIPSRAPLPSPRPDFPPWAGPSAMGTGYFPPAPQQPGFGGKMMGSMMGNPEVMLALGAGLLGGRTGPDQWSGGLGGMAQVMGDARQKQEAKAQKNKTLEWLRQNAPDYAGAVEQGVLSAGDAYKMHIDQRKAKTPNVSWQELPDGTYGWANKDDLSWSPIGKAAKPQNGFEITTADGTTIRQGPLSNQDMKNEANSVDAARQAAASATELKQTINMLRRANKNTGYSGPGGGMVGTVFDLGEKAGLDLPGDPGSRAQMRSGGLEVALQKVQQTKGAISNAEMNLFMAASPGMQQTAEGNAALLDMADAIADRAIQRAQEMERWRAQNGTMSGFEAAWSEYINANPIVTEDKILGAQGGEDVDALIERYGGGGM